MGCFIMRVILKDNCRDQLLPKLAQLLECMFYIVDKDDSILKAGHAV